jgi:hypothetical protein
MRPTPADLSDSTRYDLLDEIAHENLVPKVQAYLKRPGPVKLAYIAANLVIVAIIGFLSASTNTPLVSALDRLCLGMFLGYVLLLPVHEWVHALAYRRFGAEKTRVVYTWRTLSAYCVADHFVATAREFALVCLMPFLVLNTILIATIAIVGGFSPILWGMLLLHVGACSGDFAFVNYLWHHRGRGLLTYDDTSQGRSYFYALRSA